MENRDYYYEQEVDFDAIEVTIEKVNGIGITRMKDKYGYNYFKGSDVTNLLKVFNDVPKSFTIGKVIEADNLFDIEGVLKYDEKTDTATKYSPYWLSLKALDNAFKNSRYNTEYLYNTLNLLNDLLDWIDRYDFVYEEKFELEVEDKLEVNDKYGTVISSRLVAQQMGKEHFHIMERIKQVIDQLTKENRNHDYHFIPSVYKVSGQFKEYKEYLLTKKGFTLLMFNVQGYNDFKFDYIERFEQMENHMQELVRIETEKRVKELERQLKEYEVIHGRQKVVGKLGGSRYVKSYNISEIAREIDSEMEGKELNQKLKEYGLQYKTAGMWLVYPQFNHLGLTATDTYIDENGNAKPYTKWTEKGREYILEIMNEMKLELAI
ncbi:Rha family transcriptional regulator [Mammaliicoccus sciuri]|uniref:Rha family transcriptional regulator n=1 Tax=Mammaliicoccus sciuri TaxID=1296 RepID=UPI0019D3AA80|nr:Rha family transcriptional regulator [Mammaliicoccus sciuri]QSN68418.1 Rha family transcriptional regulator [Mammaliicoccus sciuri]UIU23158.1 phage regulatory protein/antirepressor Ant [Mammaliicoccus sciuri]UIU26063.1 phage regulatory protein/antirepressor Ant [Mammaliicoccus sciuri]